MQQAYIKMKDTALLVIDVINSCSHPKCEPSGLSFKKIRKMIPKLSEFIDKYRKYQGKIVFINCTPWNKTHLADNIIELYKDPKCRYFSKDKSGFSEEFYQLKPSKNDLIITKNSYDAFTNNKLDRILKSKKYLIITGIFGDGCVHATIQGGFSKGYNFIILKDLIETTDVEIRQKLQNLMKSYTWPVMFGPTIDSKDFFNVVHS